MTSQLAFKVLENGRSCHGGSLEWSLPNGKPGEWHEVKGPVISCSNGLHLTTKPILWWRSGSTLYEAEYEGDTSVMEDKIAVRRCRLLREVSWDDHFVWSSGAHAIKDGERAIASGSATVRASDSATVRAFDSATVRAFDSATVEAFDSATVRAFDSATVRASDSATVRAFDSATVRAFDSATVEAFDSATVRAFDSATVRASGSATVRAFGSATVRAFGSANLIRTQWHRGGYIKLSEAAAVIDRRKDGAVEFHAAPWSDEPATK